MYFSSCLPEQEDKQQGYWCFKYTTIEKSAAHRAMRAICVFEPKSTMLEMVEAMLALICVMMKTPRKLKIVLMMIAALGGRQRVVTHVAIAFLSLIHI